MEVISQHNSMTALPAGKKNSGTHEIVGCLGREVGLDRFREGENHLPLPVFKCRTVQPVAKLYGLSLTAYESKSQNIIHTLCKIDTLAIHTNWQLSNLSAIYLTLQLFVCKYRKIPGDHCGSRKSTQPALHKASQKFFLYIC
jgi:hypothetical protein